MNVFEKLPAAAREAILRPLLDYLARAERRADGRWGIWWVANIDGGRNNWLYRALCALSEIVVKFTIRDERDAPLLLDCERGMSFGLPKLLPTAGKDAD